MHLVYRCSHRQFRNVRLFGILILFLFYCSSFSIFGEEGKKSVGPSPEALRKKEFRQDWKFQGNLAYQYILQLQTLGRNRLVIRHTSDFLILFPNHARAVDVLAVRARQFLKMKHINQAVHVFLLLFRKHPDTKQGARAALEAGRILSRQGRVAQAVQILKALMRRHPASKSFRLAEIELDSLRFLDSRAGNVKNAVKFANSESGKPIKNTRN